MDANGTCLMKVVACVKWVGALGDDVEFVDDERAVDPDYLDFSLNEWDAYATEEALRLRDAAGGGEVVAITVGSEDAEKALVHCLAMGADRAVRVALDGHDALDPLQVGQLLAAAVQPEQPDLVLCGAQSSDAAHGATGAALAAVLGFPCATIVKKVEFDATAGVALVQRELEGGVIETAEIESPAVLTIQTGINEPRYVTLRAVNQARRAEIPVIPGETTRPEAVGCRIRRMYVPARGRAEMIRGDPRAIAERVAELIREATV